MTALFRDPKAQGHDCDVNADGQRFDRDHSGRDERDGGQGDSELDG